MQQVEEILNKIPYEKIWVMPPWQRWLAAFAVVCLFFVIYYFVSHKGASEKINTLISKRNTLEADHKKYVKHTKRMPEIQRDIDALNADLETARIQLPSAKDIPELLINISHTGTDTGLEFLLFKPFPEEKVDFYSKVPVEMVIQGSYHNVATFFDKVRKMLRIVDISDVKITSVTKKGRTSLKTSCKATTYKYLEKAALETEPKKKKKKKK